MVPGQSGSAVTIPQLDPCSFERIANGSGGETKLLADGSERVAVCIKLLRLLDKL
jgi:hypothetical protein